MGLNIAKTRDGRNILYDINKIHQVGETTLSAKKQTGQNSFLMDNNSITNNSKNVNTQNENRDNAYMQAVENGDTATAQKLVDDVVYDLVANVRKKTDDSYVYSLQLNENKKMVASPPLRKNNSALNRVPNATNNSIHDNFKNVNTQLETRDTEYMQATFRDKFCI